MALLRYLLNLLLGRLKQPDEAQHVEAKMTVGRLVVAGGFDGKDKAGRPEALTDVNVYAMPGRVKMTGGAVAITPPSTPGIPVQFQVTFDGLDWADNSSHDLLVCLVDDEQTENAGVAVTAVAPPDTAPTEATGVTATFTPM